MQQERHDRESSTRPKSVGELQDHFIKLYGRRNNIWLPGRMPRINLLNVAIADLQDAVRKNSHHEHLEVMFARLPSRIFCIAQAVNEVSVASAMMEKYPLAGCVYCHSFPCQCDIRRSDAELAQVALQGVQQQWNLKDWQEHLGRLYGDNNRRLGIENVINRCFKEVAELMNLEHEIPKADPAGIMTASFVEHEFALELADCLAWTMGAANLLEVDLEQVTIDRFWPDCWNCHQKPCVCINFNFQAVRG